MALNLNNTVLSIIAVAIGLVLIGSLLAPIAVDVMSTLTGLGDDGASWASIVGVCVIVSILGLIIVALNGFMKDRA